MKPSLITAFFACVFALGTSAQMKLDEVAYDEIPYKKIRNYLESLHLDKNIDCFDELTPTCQGGDFDFTGFYTYTKQYVVKAGFVDVWNTYLTSDPMLGWTTKKSAVGLLYDRSHDQLVYSTDSAIQSEIGQVLYLNLKLMKGLYNLATALEITDIADSGQIEISYVSEGINEGKQWITMKERSDGKTVITHTSIIRSGSHFRDKFLYPYFHNKLINAFHRNMRKRVYAASPLELAAESDT